MSRGPSPDGVGNLRHSLAKFRRLRIRVIELRQLVAELPKVEQEAEAAGREVLKALEEMDVAANGNCGWEGRVLAFLNELDIQASRVG